MGSVPLVLRKPSYTQLVRCLTCQYDLENLPEHRCPECGRAFDPDKPTSFSSDDDWVPVVIWLAVLLGPLLVLMGALLVVCVLLAVG
jgi:predicted amidophosphoribosyltransferase